MFSRGSAYDPEVKITLEDIMSKAVKTGDLLAMKHCVAYGVNIKAVTFFNRETFLHIAVYHREKATTKRLEIVKFLVESGVDLEALNSFQETALIMAVKRRDCEVIEFLWNTGANKANFVQWVCNTINARNINNTCTEISRSGFHNIIDSQQKPNDDDDFDLKEIRILQIELPKYIACNQLQIWESKSMAVEFKKIMQQEARNNKLVRPANDLYRTLECVLKQLENKTIEINFNTLETTKLPEPVEDKTNNVEPLKGQSKKDFLSFFKIYKAFPSPVRLSICAATLGANSLPLKQVEDNGRLVLKRI